MIWVLVVIVSPLFTLFTTTHPFTAIIDVLLRCEPIGLVLHAEDIRPNCMAHMKLRRQAPIGSDWNFC